MDDQTLETLHAALAASPDNRPLRLVLIRGHRERGENQRAMELADAVPLDGLADDERVLLAEVFLGGGAPDRALQVAPEGSIERARALLALDRVDDARACYEALVAANPTAQSVDFERLLNARAPAVDAGRPRLRVIDNDPDATPAEVRRLLQPAQERVTFADVGGHADVKREIRRRIILPFQKPSIFQRFRRKAGGGVLLYGPPGCGKTLLARATAGECQARFIAVSISDVLDMYTGESERKLHALFDLARRSAPAVLFFDEVEALGGKREYGRSAHTAQLVSQFLSEMDGFAQNNQGVLVLGATNVPWALDPAFRRPGRFDRVLFVPPPDREARAAILRIHLSDRPVAPNIDVDQIARLTGGYSGADLAGLVEAAADEAIERSLAEGRETPIDHDALRRALKQARSTTLEWLTTARNYARYANEGGQYDDVLQFLERHGK